MNAAEAMIDAAVTIRTWQRERLTAADVARQLGCPHDWDAVENFIVIDLLWRNAKRAAPVRLAA